MNDHFSDDDMSPEEESQTPPFFTWGLIFLHALAFLLMLLDGASAMLVSSEDLIRFGAVSAVDIWRGEVWRLFTGIALHGAIWHLGFNMWVLWQIGPLVERFLGVFRSLLLYIVVGAVSFAASILWHPGLTVGASGAIFGLVGSLFAVAWLLRIGQLGKVLWRALVPFVAVNLGIGFLLPFVDMTAHAFGLLFGALLGFGLVTDRLPILASAQEPLHNIVGQMRRTEKWGWISLVASVIITAVLLPVSVHPWFSPRYHTMLGFADLRDGNQNGAQTHLQEAERYAPDDADVLLLHGRLLYQPINQPADDDQDEKNGDQQKSLAFIDAALRKYADADEDPWMTVMRLTQGTGDVFLFVDPLLSDAICSLIVEPIPETPPSTAHLEPANPYHLHDLSISYNECAWLWLKTDHQKIRKPELALHTARRAVEIVLARNDFDAAIFHTYAEALLQNNQIEEALVWIQKILYSSEKNAFFEKEYARMNGIHQANIHKNAPKIIPTPIPPPAPTP